MVDFEWTAPHNQFLIGIDLLDGTLEDNGEIREIKIFSVGFIFFKLSILFFV